MQYAIWLYLHFTLSLRDVGDLLAERGITVTVRGWVDRGESSIVERPLGLGVHVLAEAVQYVSERLELHAA